MAIDNKTMVTVVNKRSFPYTVSTPSGEYYEWLPAREDYEDSHELTFREVSWLHTQTSTFREGYLFIDNEEVRKRFGLESEKQKVLNLSRSEIETMLKGNMKALKKLEDVKDNKSLILDVVEVAKELKITNATKLEYLSELSGIPFELIREDMKDNDEE